MENLSCQAKEYFSDEVRWVHVLVSNPNTDLKPSRLPMIPVIKKDTCVKNPDHPTIAEMSACLKSGSSDDVKMVPPPKPVTWRSGGHPQTQLRTVWSNRAESTWNVTRTVWVGECTTPPADSLYESWDDMVMNECKNKMWKVKLEMKWKKLHQQSEKPCSEYFFLISLRVQGSLNFTILRFVGGYETGLSGDHERELEATSCHCWPPGWRLFNQVCLTFCDLNQK